MRQNLNEKRLKLNYSIFRASQPSQKESELYLTPYAKTFYFTVTRAFMMRVIPLAKLPARVPKTPFPIPWDAALVAAINNAWSVERTARPKVGRKLSFSPAARRSAPMSSKGSKLEEQIFRSAQAKEKPFARTNDAEPSREGLMAIFSKAY
jgi:hypothetical protein